MSRTGRPKSNLVLSDAEANALRGWVRRPKTTQATALRARIILACAEGKSNKDVAVAFGTTPQTVAKWRHRFVVHRLDGLTDRARPGRSKTVTSRQLCEVVIATLSTAPAAGGRWSTRSMAAQMRLSQSTVSRIWRAFSLLPARACDDPGPAEVVGIQLSRSRCMLVIAVANAFRGGRVSSGNAAALPRYRRSGQLRFLMAVDHGAPDNADLHLICDHNVTADVMSWLAEHPNFHLHCSPANECWQLLTSPRTAELVATRTSTHTIADLEHVINCWHATQCPRPFRWTKYSLII